MVYFDEITSNMVRLGIRLQRCGTFNPKNSFLVAQGGWVIPSQTYNNFYLSYTFHMGSLSHLSRWGELDRFDSE